MSEAMEYIRLLEETGRVKPGAIQKLAASAFQPTALEKVKELVGIKRPLHRRIAQYFGEGVSTAKGSAALRLGFLGLGIGTTLGVAAAVSAHNKMKFNAALKSLLKDTDVQADPEKAKSIAKMVRRWAPSIAADTEVLKGTVKNLMKFPDSYLTFDVAKKLSEAEKEYQATHGLLSLLQKRIL